MNSIINQITEDEFDHLDISEYLDSIEKICVDNPSKDRWNRKGVEGNCVSEHLHIKKRLDSLKMKQMNLYNCGKYSKNILEIGFNAGHSALFFLLANNESKLTLFDTCQHPYTEICFDYLNKKFPNRLTLVKGDSQKTVPEYIINNPQQKFDLIHIDGSHIMKHAYNDLNNTFKVANKIIIFDDTDCEELNSMLNEFVMNNNLNEIFLQDISQCKYQHRIFSVIN